MTRDQSEENMKASNSGLLQSAVMIAFMIMLSRVLGMLRDIVSAQTFGLGWTWDAFIYAFMVPNFFRRIVGEGALSSAFIPVYNDIREKQGESEAFKYANLVYSFMGVALIVFILLVEVVLQAALKWGVFPDVVRLAMSLLQVMFPHLWFLCAYAIGMGVLNSHKHFFTPMLGPVLMNAIWIAVMLWVFPFMQNEPVVRLHALAWAMTFAGVVHWVVEWPSLEKMGFRFKWLWEWPHEGLMRSGRLLAPVLLGFAAVQVNMLVDTVFAYWIGPGANSSLWYGNRVMQLPLAMFGVAMGNALLPLLSSQIAAGKQNEAKETLAFSLSMVFMVVLPASTGLIALAPDIMRLLFERGQFDAASTARTASVLAAYSIGLFAFSGQKMMITGYYAAHDSKTPMKIGLISLLLNAVGNFILMHTFKETGLAISTSFAAIIQFLILMFVYPKKVGTFPFKKMSVNFFKTLVASIVMAFVARLGLDYWKQVAPAHSVTAYAIQVLGTIALAGVVYLIALFVIQKKDAMQALGYLISKKKKSVNLAVEHADPS